MVINVLFALPSRNLETISGATLTPYGLPCIRELLRFLITLINPLDKQNSDAMVHMGLSLMTIALEVGADSIGKYDTLLEMMKDDLCRNLFAVSYWINSSTMIQRWQFLTFPSRKHSKTFSIQFTAIKH